MGKRRYEETEQERKSREAYEAEQAERARLQKERVETVTAGLKARFAEVEADFKRHLETETQNPVALGRVISQTWKHVRVSMSFEGGRSQIYVTPTAPDEVTENSLYYAKNVDEYIAAYWPSLAEIKTFIKGFEAGENTRKDTGYAFEPDPRFPPVFQPFWGSRYFGR